MWCASIVICTRYLFEFSIVVVVSDDWPLACTLLAGAPPKHLKMRTYSDQLGVAVGEQVDAQSMALRFDA